MIVGYEFWRDRLAGDPKVLGTSLKAGQQVRTIVGVAPPGFRFRSSRPADVIFPMTMPTVAPAGRERVGRSPSGASSPA